MPIAAHSATLKGGGTSTAMTTEATTDLGDNAFQITDASKRVLDPAQDITVYDDGVEVPATIDYFFGTVTLDSAATGDVTVSGNYIPLLALAEITGFEINCTRDVAETTRMDSSTSGKSRLALLKDASGSLSGLDPLTTDLDSGAGTTKLESKWSAGDAFLLDIEFTSSLAFRAWVKFPDFKAGAELADLFKSTLNWVAHSITPSSGAGAGQAAAFGFGTP